MANVEREARGIRENMANAVLIKLNQMGMLRETVATIDIVGKGRFRCNSFAPLGRDRRQPYRRLYGGDEYRSSQDRRSLHRRVVGEIQPADEHRRRVRGCGDLRQAQGVRALNPSETEMERLAL